MPIVNLLREQNRFMEYAVDKGLKPNDIALWYGLMHIINRHADGNVWPDEFISIPNARVLMYSRMTFDTMAKSRNKLIQIGLLEYKCGNRNKEAPMYRMIYFCPECYPEISDNIGSYPKISDKTQDKTQGKNGGKTQDKTRDKTQDIYININQERRINQNSYLGEDEEEDDELRAGAGARGRETAFPEDAGRTAGEGTGEPEPFPADAWDGTTEGDPIPDREERAWQIMDSFPRLFGRRAYPAEINRLVVAGWQMGMDGRMVVRAMETAAQGGARNPVEYTLTVLDDWRRAEVRRPEQIGAYQAEKDRQAGRGGQYGSGDPLEDWRAAEAARERRRAENERAEAAL